MSLKVNFEIILKILSFLIFTFSLSAKASISKFKLCQQIFPIESDQKQNEETLRLSRLELINLSSNALSWSFVIDDMEHMLSQPESSTEYLSPLKVLTNIQSSILAIHHFTSDVIEVVFKLPSLTQQEQIKRLLESNPLTYGQVIIFNLSKYHEWAGFLNHFLKIRINMSLYQTRLKSLADAQKIVFDNLLSLTPLQNDLLLKLNDINNTSTESSNSYEASSPVKSLDDSIAAVQIEINMIRNLFSHLDDFPLSETIPQMKQILFLNQLRLFNKLIQLIDHPSYNVSDGDFLSLFSQAFLPSYPPAQMEKIRFSKITHSSQTSKTSLLEDILLTLNKLTVKLLEDGNYYHEPLILKMKDYLDKTGYPKLKSIYKHHQPDHRNNPDFMGPMNHLIKLMSLLNDYRDIPF